MPQSYFIWNGIDSRRMQVICKGPAPIIKPEERVKHIEIPGRSGDMTLVEGEENRKIYAPYIQTQSISVRGEENVHRVLTWLEKPGYVTFCTDKWRRQKARVIGAVTLNRVSRNLDNYAGDIQFYCQPLKERLMDGAQTISSSDSQKLVVNEGDQWAQPLIRLTTTATNVWIRITQGNYYRQITIDMTGLSNQDIYIDCETMEVYDAPKTGWMTWRATKDSWPVLYKGENTITGGGWSKAVFTKRERFL